MSTPIEQMIEMAKNGTPISIDLWDEAFTPLYTPITEGNEEAGLFETFGKDLEFVRNQNPANIWTVVDGSDDNMYLIAGYHLVNRINYIITEQPCPPELECAEIVYFEGDYSEDDE